MDQIDFPTNEGLFVKRILSSKRRVLTFLKGKTPCFLLC
jgi:hypothetical protein